MVRILYFVSSLLHMLLCDYLLFLTANVWLSFLVLAEIWLFPKIQEGKRRRIQFWRLFCYNIFNHITNIIHIMNDVSYTNDIDCHINIHCYLGLLACHDDRFCCVAGQ